MAYQIEENFNCPLMSQDENFFRKHMHLSKSPRLRVHQSKYGCDDIIQNYNGKFVKGFMCKFDQEMLLLHN